MSEPRNDYGFPFAGVSGWVEALASNNGASLIGYWAKPISKLERAQAIAAEVRARKFPPVQRITNPKD